MHRLPLLSLSFLAAQGSLPCVGHYVSIASAVGLLGMLAMKETKDVSLS
jgi:hypothetical protein